MHLTARLLILFAVVLSAAGVSAQAQIERVNVDKSAFALGTLTPAKGALPGTLWSGSDRNAVGDLLITVPETFDEPLHLELLRRVLLSPGEGPDGADNDLAGIKLMKAARAGFYREASSLAALVPSTSTEPSLSQVIAYQELMDGRVDTACARGEGLRDGRAAAFWIKLRFVCYVRAGETAAAELTLNLLRRQDALTPEEEDRLNAFATGRPIELPETGVTVFDWVMAREGGRAFGSGLLDNADAALTAAVARADDVPEDIRERALIDSVANRTIGGDEAVELLDSISSTTLASDYLTVSAMAPGSLEHAEMLGQALRRGGADFREFSARARIFGELITEASPITNFAPNATEIALAAMVNDQGQVVDQWVTALAADQSGPAGTARARRLVEVYAHLDPERARRIGAYIGMVKEPAMPQQVVAFNAATNVPVARLVSSALPAAEAGSEGPVALVYLTGMATADDGQGGIREAVVRWARDQIDLSWFDRQVAFRTEASALLSEPAPQIGGTPAN